MAFQLGCAGCLASTSSWSTHLYWSPTQKKPAGLHPFVGTSFPVSLQGVQLRFTPTHGWSSGSCCKVRKSISTPRSWLLEMSFIIIRLSSNQRSDRGGGGSYLSKASCFLSSWNRLGDLEEADKKIITASSKEDSSTGRFGCHPRSCWVGRSCSIFSTIKSRTRKKLYEELFALIMTGSGARPGIIKTPCSITTWRTWRNQLAISFDQWTQPAIVYPWKKFYFLMDKFLRTLLRSLFSSQITGMVSWVIDKVQLEFLCVNAWHNNTHCFTRSQKHYLALTNLFCTLQ